MLQELTYKYDQAGNVLSIFDSAPLSGFTKADNQCFAYDAQRRLTEAWTPKTADCAASGRTAANLDGAAPYWNSYTYTASGQRATEKTNTGTPQTRTYCYDPARPHALASTTTGATCTGVTPQYTYDATGNTTKRAETPGSATSQGLVWTAEGKLGNLTEGTSATDYVYDADGQLLIRRDPAGETVLYTPSTEVHLKGAKKWGTRSYSISGVKAAVLTNESGTAKLSFVVGRRPRHVLPRGLRGRHPGGVQAVHHPLRLGTRSRRGQLAGRQAVPRQVRRHRQGTDPCRRP